MRIGISVAAIVLFALGAIGIYFAFDLNLLWDNAKEAEARKTLAFESVTDRLPKGKPITPTKALEVEAKARWEKLDRNFAQSQDQRATVLKEFHERKRKFFVDSPGAGSGRGGFQITDEDILLDDYHGDTRQPGEPASFPVSPGEIVNRVNPDTELHVHHEDNLRDFFRPYTFGYIKDRDHVAGFKPHGFRYLSVSSHESKPWRVDHVQLVGILAHNEPVVYLTDKLPSMEQVKQGKTRELDFFEEVALPALMEGDDLYIVSKDNTLRMLGALRATKTCQKCHDAEVSDLLGAFSYTLRPALNEKKTKD